MLGHHKTPGTASVHLSIDSGGIEQYSCFDALFSYSLKHSVTPRFMWIVILKETLMRINMYNIRFTIGVYLFAVTFNWTDSRLTTGSSNTLI